MITVRFNREGYEEHCACHINGSAYEIAVEYAVLSKKIATKFPNVLQMSEALIDELEEMPND